MRRIKVTTFSVSHKREREREDHLHKLQENLLSDFAAD
jgi:hypothetical protein